MSEETENAEWRNTVAFIAALVVALPLSVIISLITVREFPGMTLWGILVFTAMLSGFAATVAFVVSELVRWVGATADNTHAIRRLLEAQLEQQDEANESEEEEAHP